MVQILGFRGSPTWMMLTVGSRPSQMSTTVSAPLTAFSRARVLLLMDVRAAMMLALLLKASVV